MQNEKNEKEITLKLRKSVAKNFLKASIISSCLTIVFDSQSGPRANRTCWHKIFHNFFVCQHFYKIQKDKKKKSKFCILHAIETVETLFRSWGIWI